MIDTIPCRNCDHPLKSGSCLGCNVFRLYEALVKGKLNWAKDEYNGIVESKLENPTLTPDDVRPVGKWIRISGYHLDHEYYPAHYRCDQCEHSVDSGDDKNYCPDCGARMRGDDA